MSLFQLKCINNWILLRLIVHIGIGDLITFSGSVQNAHNRFCELISGTHENQNTMLLLYYLFIILSRFLFCKFGRMVAKCDESGESSRHNTGLLWSDEEFSLSVTWLVGVEDRRLDLWRSVLNNELSD